MQIAMLSFFSALVSVSYLSHVVTAQPLTQAEASRDCSSLITASYAASFDWTSSTALSLAKCLIHTPPITNSCLFYTSDSKQLALRYAFESNRNTIYDAYSPKHFDATIDPMKRWKRDGNQRDVFKITSKAYALACSGEASVVIPEDEIACPQSIWITDEYEVIKSGESAIRLPVFRVSWKQDMLKKSWGWVVSVLSTLEKREVKLQQVVEQAEELIQQKVDGLRKQWKQAVVDGEEDFWAVTNGPCGR
jgi:hypothetical protein